VTHARHGVLIRNAKGKEQGSVEVAQVVKAEVKAQFI
jgi:hypothetical protein